MCSAQAPIRELNISGLQKPVTVRRDGRGIPYIEAQSEADLFFAQGFVMASDRLWQMDLYRRFARGETAEIFGAARLEEDKRWRRFGFAANCRTNLDDDRAGSQSRAGKLCARRQRIYCDARPENFAAGISDFAVQPRPWQPTDSIVIGAILSDGLSTTWTDDLRKSSVTDLPKDKFNLLYDPQSRDDVLLIGKDKEKAKSARAEIPNFKFQISKFDKDHNSTIKTLDFITREENLRRQSLEMLGIYAENLSASNNWVISGKRTLDGKPIIANDPHLQAAQPGIWYLINLSAPGFHAAGVTLAGSPGVILGHNENIGWGATNVGPDAQDLYIETFNDKGEYKTPNGFVKAATRIEEIKVRENPLKADTRIEKLEVVNTRHGVIVAETGGKRYALNWTAFDPQSSTLDAFYFLNKAKNWTDFQVALKRYGGATQNFVYADGQGNIGWYAAGKIPLRKSGDGSLPYDGATDAGEWTGFVPFEELPHLYNPPENFIVTANQRTVGDAYKYHDVYARIYVPFRARRIYDLIAANPKMTLDVGR